MPDQADFPPPWHIQDALDRLDLKQETDMAKTKTATKTRNPQDVTVRNVKASNARDLRLARKLAELERRSDFLEERVAVLEAMSRYPRRRNG